MRARLRLEEIAAASKLADYSIAFSVRAAVSLGVVSALEQGPRPLADLARECACEPHSLGRLLLALVSAGVLAEVEPSLFALAADSMLPALAPSLRLSPDVDALGALEDRLRGEPVTDTKWRSLSPVPHSQRIERIALETLEAFLEVDGTNPIPSGASTYLLHRTLTDLGDCDAELLLRSLRFAMTAASRALVVEPVAEAAVAEDVMRLVLGQSTLRSRARFEQLVRNADFVLLGVRDLYDANVFEVGLPE